MISWDDKIVKRKVSKNIYLVVILKSLSIISSLEGKFAIQNFTFL